jgi:hypothetical protein
MCFPFTPLKNTYGPASYHASLRTIDKLKKMNNSFSKKRKRKTIIRDGWIKKGVLHAKW